MPHSIPSWLQSIPDVVKLPLTAALGFGLGIVSDQLKNALPRRRERDRFYGVVANAFALTTVTLASLRYTRSNAQDNVSAMSTLSKQWKQLMRCRDLLKQKRCAEFLKWENFKSFRGIVITVPGCPIN